MFGMVETNVLASSKIFGYNVLGISLQNGQTFLPTAKLVDYRLCSQLFFHRKAYPVNSRSSGYSQSASLLAHNRITWCVISYYDGREQNV